MENSTFIYQYSAKNQNEIERIRQKYLPKEENKLEQLRALDRKAQSAGVWQSLCLGIGGSLVFGVGMCIGLHALPGETLHSLLCMALGTLLMLPAYPLYKLLSRKTRAALAPEILRLSDEIDGK